jgi:hypothetical protein
MYVIIGSHFVPLSYISLVIVRITLNVIVRQMPLNVRYEEASTDEINLDELLDNIDNRDIMNILDQDISEVVYIFILIYHCKLQ